jgi:hypothetical protein
MSSSIPVGLPAYNYQQFEKPEEEELKIPAYPPTRINYTETDHSTFAQHAQV